MNMKINSKTSRRDVQKFIRHSLRPRIAKDLRKLRIVNEAELQTMVYFHLRRYLASDSRWALRIQPYISKKWGNKKPISYFPDIVLETARKPRIVIELKEKANLRKRTVLFDAKKLYNLKKQKIIRKGFVFYLYRDKTGELELEKQKEVTSWLPPRYRHHVYCIVINAYCHVPKKKLDQMG